MATTSTTGRAARRQSNGAAAAAARGAFTLLELILVLAIISIAIALAVPTLHGFAQGRRAVNCADEIVALARWAHTQSITRGLTYRFNLNPTARTYWLSVENDDGTVGPPGEEFGRIFQAPDGVTITWNAAPKQDGGTYLQFQPTGRTDPATIQVTDVTGHVTQVTCDSATELFHIVTDQELQRS